MKPSTYIKNYNSALPTEHLPMDNLSVGDVATVYSVNRCGKELQRMEDLGFVKGACVKALHKSPNGDPTAYSIMGAVIALRNDDAKNILLERQGSPCSK